MAKPNDTNLERLVERIVTAMQPEAIYLFGSRARGEAQSDSDYDLLVVLPDNAPPERRSLRATAAIPRDPGVAADIVPCRRLAFERRRGLVGTLSHRAVTESGLVYGH